MKHTTQSMLWATLLAASGLVAAQTPALSADGTSPLTRAEVKSQIPQVGSAGDKRGEGPVVNVPTGGNSQNTRAGVKGEITSKGTSGVERGEGPVVNVPAGGNSQNSRAGVKGEITSKATSGVERGEGPIIDNKSTMTSTERKAKRDERRAKAKAKRDGAMKTGSTSPAPVSGIAR